MSKEILKSQIWAFYCKKNQGFSKEESETITLTIKGLRKMVDLTVDKTWEDAYNKGKADEKKQSDALKKFMDQYGGDPTSNPFDTFGDLFKGK